MNAADQTHDPPKRRQSPRLADLTPQQLLQAYTGGPGGAPPHPDAIADDDVLIAREPRDPSAVKALTQARSHLIPFPGYRLLARALSDALGPTEPMELVQLMASGRYRWARWPNRTLQVDGDGLAVPDTMALREISAELTRISGEPVNHETIRRWQGLVWPDGMPRLPAVAAVPARVVLSALDRAEQEALDGQTNPDVPPATFVAPD